MSDEARKAAILKTYHRGGFWSKSEEQDTFYLTRCYVCNPLNGRENSAMCVSLGQCAWCGFDAMTMENLAIAAEVV
jgi:hypothetical protein